MEVEQLIETHKAGLAHDEEEVAQFVFNEDTLGQAIQNADDPEQAHRLFLAMQRINAVQTESVFHFFRDTSDSIAVQPKFPANCLPQHRWTSSFRGAHSFLSTVGIITNMHKMRPHETKRSCPASRSRLSACRRFQTNWLCGN